MSRSLMIRFVLAGLLPLLVASGFRFVQVRSADRREANQTAGSRASTVAGELTRELRHWRTELLVASNNPVLRQWFEQPENDDALRGELDRALLQLSTLNPGLIDEASFISATGQELARQVKGVTAPAADLSPDASTNPFFAATLGLDEGQVDQNAPYISPDSHRWVIPNSTPIVVDGKKVAILHFESNLDAVRVRLAEVAGKNSALRVIDSLTLTTVADSRSTQPILGEPREQSSVHPLPANWQNVSVAVDTPDAKGYRWRVEVAVAPASTFTDSLAVRFVALIVLTCAALLFLARRSASAIVTPIRRIATVAEALAGGDRNQRVEVAGYDEIAHVGNAFNTMVDSLGAQDARLAEARSERERDLTANIEHQRVSEQRLRERAQASIDATVNSVSSELQQLSEQVEVVRQSAATIEERASATDEVARTLIEQAHMAEKVVAQLQASLSEVDDMTRLIASVADQTKLLALNATIEAARAGEAGRGFTVVAGEVKDLAMATGRSTDQIAATINTLNTHSDAVAAAIAAMSGGITGVGDAATVLRNVAEQQFSVVAALNAQVDDTRDRVETMSSVTTHLERRAQPRFALSGRVKLTLAGRPLSGKLVDISEGGLRCQVETAGIQAGQAGSATFALDGREITVTARVVGCWSNSGPGEIGLHFENLSAELVSAISNFVSQQA
jgi:methyl-accepting chemotaxis protein